MPAPDDSAAVARDRLAALRLEPRGWVPEQTGISFPAPRDAGPTATSTQPPPAHGPARPLRPAWWESVALVASNRAVLGLASVCAVCLLVTGWTLFHPRAAAVPPPVEAPVSTAPLPLPVPTAAGIVVDVGGRVRRPGLVTLPAGSRVADAIRAAGGVVRQADLALVNLAAKVSDGQLLLIGVPGATSGDGGVAGSGGLVNLNSATADALDALPGIGPVLAQRIIDWRSAHGGFASVKDLDQVSGIGTSIYAEISPLVTV
jgi:competence protein ComEA